MDTDIGRTTTPQPGDVSSSPAGGTESALDAAKDTAKEVGRTVADQAREVGGEVTAQGRNLAAEARRKLQTQAGDQTGRLARGLHDAADQLDAMTRQQSDSPAGMVVERLGQGARSAAGYLDSHEPQDLLREVQDFARRRPGAFLVGAAVLGFVAGRAGKAIMSSAGDTPLTAPEPSTTPAQVMDPGTSTATGTPDAFIGFTEPDLAATGPATLAGDDRIVTDAGAPARSGAPR